MVYILAPNLSVSKWIANFSYIYSLFTGKLECSHFKIMNCIIRYIHYYLQFAILPTFDQFKVHIDNIYILTVLCKRHGLNDMRFSFIKVCYQKNSIWLIHLWIAIWVYKTHTRRITLNFNKRGIKLPETKGDRLLSRAKIVVVPGEGYMWQSEGGYEVIKTVNRLYLFSNY